MVSLSELNKFFDQIIQNRLENVEEITHQRNAWNSKMSVLYGPKHGTVNNNASEFLLLVHPQPYYWSKSLSGSCLNEIFAYFRKKTYFLKPFLPWTTARVKFMLVWTAPKLFWILSQILLWSKLFLCNYCGRFKGVGKILSNKKVLQSATSAHARNWGPMMYGGTASVAITIALINCTFDLWFSLSN